MPEGCNRARLAAYFADQLDVDEKLNFLFHLDGCPRCWEEVYHTIKAQHPHFYKTTSRQVRLTERELKEIVGREKEDGVLAMA